MLTRQQFSMIMSSVLQSLRIACSFTVFPCVRIRVLNCRLFPFNSCLSVIDYQCCANPKTMQLLVMRQNECLRVLKISQNSRLFLFTNFKDGSHEFGQETERVYSYNLGAQISVVNPGIFLIPESEWEWFAQHLYNRPLGFDLCDRQQQRHNFNLTPHYHVKLNTDLFQGSAATDFRGGGTFSSGIIHRSFLH